MVNYYKLLEITDDASAEVIHAAYKVKAKKYHPDNYISQTDRENAAEKWKLLNEARDILTDPNTRRTYDNSLKGQTFKIGEDDQDKLFTEVQSMISSIKSETEYLTLHQRISGLHLSDQQKAAMHSILDKITAERLKEELESVRQIGNYQGEVRSLRDGIGIIIIIGLIANTWFSYTFLIGLIIGIFCYIGGKKDREMLASAQIAEKRIMIYRQHGFQIW